MTVRIAVLTVSDRASRGEYEDLGGPAVKAWLERVMSSPAEIVVHVIPDGLESVRDTLIRLCDEDRVDMVLTTGGTGPSPRDLTPEAMKEVMEKELPGFGELMRKVSLEQVPTAILSRSGSEHPVDRRDHQHGQQPSTRPARTEARSPAPGRSGRSGSPPRRSSPQARSAGSA
jgi:molybdenum cofactor synthesis domain-containing protein